MLDKTRIISGLTTLLQKKILNSCWICHVVFGKS